MNKHEALAAAVTGIDDELLQEAANGLPAPRRPVFARWGAMAAALLLVSQCCGSSPARSAFRWGIPPSAAGRCRSRKAPLPAPWRSRSCIPLSRWSLR